MYLLTHSLPQTTRDGPINLFHNQRHNRYIQNQFYSWGGSVFRLIIPSLEFVYITAAIMCPRSHVDTTSDQCSGIWNPSLKILHLPLSRGDIRIGKTSNKSLYPVFKSLQAWVYFLSYSLSFPFLSQNIIEVFLNGKNKEIKEKIKTLGYYNFLS